MEQAVSVPAGETVEADDRGMHWQPGTDGGRVTSRFEFWPTWLIYAPVVAQWLALALRHRSLTLPLLANPRLPLAGMVGVAKSTLMEQAVGACREAILPWTRYEATTDPAADQARTCLAQADAAGIELPCVCKPDIGCRGVGVKLVRSPAQLAAVIAAYPPGAALLCQRLSRWAPEAGIFFVREPGSGRGRVVSMTFKYTPVVTGDGRRTLGELVAADARAGPLQHLYRRRNARDWERVLAPGERHRLVFSASHCRGAVFRDARAYITPALERAVTALMAGLPEFHYGRLDVKFPDLDALQEGRGLEILEINGASAESIHIWDRDARLREAWATLLWQYRTLFRLGAAQRRRGHRPPGPVALWRHWQRERRLSRAYPDTD